MTVIRITKYFTNYLFSTFIKKLLSFLYLFYKGINVSYPIIVQSLDVEIKVEKNIKIGRNCSLNGMIKLESGVNIGDSTVLNGDIYIYPEG